jgi:hypothetical protein
MNVTKLVITSQLSYFLHPCNTPHGSKAMIADVHITRMNLQPAFAVLQPTSVVVIVGIQPPLNERQRAVQFLSGAIFTGSLSCAVGALDTEIEGAKRILSRLHLSIHPRTRPAAQHDIQACAGPSCAHPSQGRMRLVPPPAACSRLVRQQQQRQPQGNRHKLRQVTRT